MGHTEQKVRTLTLTATDPSGQRRYKVKGIREDRSVGELLDRLVRDLDLPKNDPQGKPNIFGLHLPREGRQVHIGELIGDALKDGDTVQLNPTVSAGA